MHGLIIAITNWFKLNTKSAKLSIDWPEKSKKVREKQKVKRDIIE